MEQKETIIISLGGSIIVPDGIDTDFLKEFKKLILSHVREDKRFVIVTGGGKLCRRYQEAAKILASPTIVDLDWIGIASLKLNAELMRVVFGDDAHERVVADLSQPLSSPKPIIVGSAYEPGHSTDYDAILAAKNLGAKTVINLSNIDYVYDSDPKKNPQAKKLEKVSWAEYRKLIPEEWTSGLNSPFDPTASKLAQDLGIKVVVMNGKPIKNLANYLNGKEFLGTVIS